MAYPTELWRRLLYLGHRARFHSELSEEMEFHIASRADELEARGIPRVDALIRARREFGSAARTAEEAREAWQFAWLEDLFSDVRYSARALRRNPGFALAAVFCLALGIGANTTIFNIATSFLLSQPSVRDASSVISIQEGGNSNTSLADYRFVRDAGVFEGAAGIDPESQVNWRDGDQARRLYAARVTDDYFSTLGVPCELGRGIARGETDTVVLSNRLWRTRFNGDRSVLGRRLLLDGNGYTVAGVLPADSRSVVGFGNSPDIYVPLGNDDSVQLYARMPAGMTIAAGRANVRTVLQELDRIKPPEGWKRTDPVCVTGLTGLPLLGFEQFADVVKFFAVILALATLVLLIACTNVASLLLARASSRSGELAIRVSLGAGRMRIVRHLMAESIVLAALGGVAGFLITVICGRLLSRWILPTPVPMQVVVRPDARLLLLAILMAVLSVLMSGLMPALKAARKDVNSVLKREERQTGSGWGLRGVMVAGQTAVSVVLLVMGLLFVHNLLRAASTNPGFDVDHTIRAYVRLVPDRYRDPVRQRLLVEEALGRLRALPGVDAAAIVRNVPLNGNSIMDTTVRTDLPGSGTHFNFVWNGAGTDYFRAVGIPVLRGREFDASDGKGAETPAVINETFARTAFGNADPLGHAITFGRSFRMRIVGVVRDSKYFTLGETQRAALYDPYFSREAQTDLQFIVRAAGSPAGYVRPIQDVLGQLDPTAAVETKPMIQSLGLALLPSQAGAAMFGAMGLLGLVLAAIGLYGGLLYTVSRRTREIGLRVALGSTPGGVLRVVCRSTMVLAGSGMLIGLTLANFATRPLAMFLVPGLSAMDPASFVSVAAVFIGIALAATIVPAVRALRLDPMLALRYD